MNKLDYYILDNIYSFLMTLEDKKNLIFVNSYLKKKFKNKFIGDIHKILKQNPNRDWLFLKFIKNDDYFGIQYISNKVSLNLILNTYFISYRNIKLFNILLPIVTYIFITNNYHKKPQV